MNILQRVLFLLLYGYKAYKKKLKEIEFEKYGYAWGGMRSMETPPPIHKFYR